METQNSVEQSCLSAAQLQRGFPCDASVRERDSIAVYQAF